MITAKLMSVSELLNDGWTVSNMDDGEQALKKGGYFSIRARNWPKLGKPIVLGKNPNGRGWVDADLQLWSGAALSAVRSTRPVPTATIQPCSCDIKQLWDYGCICGGFARERAAGRRA